MINYRHYGLVFLAGIMMVLGFAPFYWYPLPIVSLFILFDTWHQARTPTQAARLGFAFGMGLYLVGIYWIYICLHNYGGMPWWFAGLSTLFLCGFMATFPAIVGYISVRYGQLLWSAPLFWALSDWTRGWIFTGFPWLTLGYSQVPHSPLTGYLPVIGIYGLSLITAFIASLLAHWWMKKKKAVLWTRNAFAALIIVLLIGGALKSLEWSRAVGKPIQVALLQGNVNQLIKWSPENAMETISLYQNMIMQTQAKLVVLPETALPVLENHVPEVFKEQTLALMRAQFGNVIIGLVTFDEEKSAYYNSAVSYGFSPTQRYSKQHLVPFGEFIPLKKFFGWIYRDWLHMPLSDLSRGEEQKPMKLGKQAVAVNICYEDVFGEEIAKMLPEATMLVNISNDAWYGNSYAADQHMQFSQARAIETGRMVLRSTNTGATAIIDRQGKVLDHAPHDVPFVLTGKVQGYQGVTPYVRWKNGLFLLISGVTLMMLWRRRQSIS